MDEIVIGSLAAKAIEAEDFAEACRLLEPLIASDSEYALMSLGWMHEAGRVIPSDRKLAASLYARASKIGCLEAFNALGRVHRNDGEFTEARKAFQAGAELGNLGSMCWLGAMMIWGQGGPIDTENGSVWLNRAADKGHLAAKGQLLILERQNSKSIFRHLIYFFKWISLGLRGYREYTTDPYSGKVF
jgi:TPR repeat protein